MPDYPNRPAHLFVYGTLMRRGGHPMHRVLADGARFVSEAWFNGRLYQVHHYPGAVASRATDDRVFGELYVLHSPEKTLALLDDYEGCGPGAPQPAEFARSIQHVRRTEGTVVDAWVYLYNWPVGPAPRIVSGRFSAKP